MLPHPDRRALTLPVVCGLALLGLGIGVPHAGLSRAFLAAAGVLLVWTAALYGTSLRRGRGLALQLQLRPQHWLQACAQTAVLLYWGRGFAAVYAFIPLIAAQLIFAYGIEALTCWSRRDQYRLGFGPFPVILSINLFLWFKPDWFVLQLAMIPVGFLAKEWIHWRREGRPAHIFNPSSFPLAVLSLMLIATHRSDITVGSEIAASQFYPPNMYLAIFLAALPGQILFGVATMTASAVVTLYAISLGYLGLNGSYLFYDTHIPIAVFLGMHLLFTDPSTSPRSHTGRIAFGALYAVGTAVAYALLSAMGEPTFYDKLLPVPLLNLLVRRIDRLAAAGWLSPLDPRRMGERLATTRPYWVPTAAWGVVFLGLSALHGVGDNPPGQALPFWQRACEAGSRRACAYQFQMTYNYCNEGSGWACNEWGVQQVRLGRSPARAFERSCQLGFAPGCQNATVAGNKRTTFARGDPLGPDWPIVLRGSRLPLRGRSAGELLRRACTQGWPGTCPRTSSATG